MTLGAAHGEPTRQPTAPHSESRKTPPIYTLTLSSSPASPICTFLTLTSTYLTALAASTVIYRLSPWHPLARYPGPLGCRVSKLWMGAVCVPGFQHRYIQALHERYGDVVRIGALSVWVWVWILRWPVLGLGS